MTKQDRFWCLLFVQLGPAQCVFILSCIRFFSRVLFLFVFSSSRTVQVYIVVDLLSLPPFPPFLPLSSPAKIASSHLPSGSAKEGERCVTSLFFLLPPRSRSGRAPTALTGFNQERFHPKGAGVVYSLLAGSPRFVPGLHMPLYRDSLSPQVVAEEKVWELS